MNVMRCMVCGWQGDLDECDKVPGGGFIVSKCPGCGHKGCWEEPWEEVEITEEKQTGIGDFAGTSEK